MNKVELVGRLTRDPEIRQAGETQVCNFTIAVNRRKKEQDHDADFPRCVAFGKTAENIGKYFRKGSQIGVVGHLQTGSYDHRDGYKVYTTDVIVEEFDFIDKKQEQANERENASALDDPFGLD